MRRGVSYYQNTTVPQRLILIDNTRNIPLQWHQNGRDGISKHQLHDCLLSSLFRQRSKKLSQLWVTGVCAGNLPITEEFPAQRASNAENVSIRWRQHAKTKHYWSYVRKPTIISGLPLQRTSNLGSVLMSLCHDAGIVTLGSHSGVSVRRASGQDSCSEEPGRLATPQLRNWRAPGFVPPGTITVLLQDIPGDKGSLPIRYPDLIRPMYWVSFVGI